MHELLRVTHLKKAFVSGGFLWGGAKREIWAVNGVSFSLQQGKTLGLVGESGCGKSTLAKTVLRLVSATSGEVVVNGQDVLKLRGERLRAFRKNMQMIFQDPYASLNPRMKVGDIVGEPLWVQREVTSRQELGSRVAKLLEQVGLSASAIHKFPHEFSGGQRQRIGIARAIALSPSLVVCDEPVSALDVSIQSQILNLLADLQSVYHMGYLFISHDLRVVQHIAHDVAVMYLGKFMEVAPTGMLYQEPLHPYTQMLLSAVPEPVYGSKKTRLLPKGDIPSPSKPPSGCVFHTRCPLAIDKCKTVVPELREVKPGHKVACILV